MTKTVDPKESAQNIAMLIYQLKVRCQNECEKLHDPKAQALLETTADVLEALEKAFSDYQSENIGGWVSDENRTTPM